MFLAAFRDAADRLRSGDRNARFPAGSYESLKEGLQLVEDLWDSIAVASATMPLTEEQRPSMTRIQI
jgi:hypothetical protein